MFSKHFDFLSVTSNYLSQFQILVQEQKQQLSDAYNHMAVPGLPFEIDKALQNPHYVGKFGENLPIPFVHACTSGYVEIVQFLLLSQHECFTSPEEKIICLLKTIGHS